MEDVQEYLNFNNARRRWRGRYDPCIDWDSVYETIRYTYPPDADEYVAILAGDYTPPLDRVELSFPLEHDLIWVGRFLVPLERVALMKVPKLVMFRYDHSPIELKLGSLICLCRALAKLCLAARRPLSFYIEWADADHLILNETSRCRLPSEPDDAPIDDTTQRSLSTSPIPIRRMRDLI